MYATGGHDGRMDATGEEDLHIFGGVWQRLQKQILEHCFKFASSCFLISMSVGSIQSNATQTLTGL